jgi:hypothetical protein
LSKRNAVTCGAAWTRAERNNDVRKKSSERELQVAAAVQGKRNGEARAAGLGTQVVFISPGGIFGAVPSMHCRRGVLRWPAVQQDSDRRGRKVPGGDGLGRMGRKARREAFSMN